MEDKIEVPYNTAKKFLLDILEHNDFSEDREVVDVMKTLVGKQLQLEGVNHSELVVDSRCRIFLPRFSINELDMESLPKAVYLLFLLHHEGLHFKLLNNYRNELLRIYLLVEKEKNIDALKAKRTIDSITDPDKNRIYEVCSLIRGSLREVVDESVFPQYDICGNRGKRYRIALNRNLVIIENKDLRDMSRF